MMVGSVYADTTSNLIGGSWNNVVNGTHPNNCCSGGPAPLYDPATNTIHFSYGLTAVHQVVAINQALSGTGIQISGWNWGYDLRNMNGVAGGQGGTDTINVTSFITNSAGQIIQQSDQYYNTQFDWTTFSGTVNLNTALSLENSGSLGIQFVSRDSGFWAGYYGPQVRNVTLNANYSVDQCSANPLSSTTCPGYEAAYLSMQCSANSLYSSSCPGYAQAYYTQQCTINPLYNAGCPGYQQAYYTQQCTANPLYDSGCPGYQQAYFDLQCSLNPLHDSSCTGYQTAFFNQQCNLDGLYSNQCPNYAEAYAKKSLLSKESAPSVPTNTEPTVTVSTDGKVSNNVKLVEDDNVNKVITETATSAAPSPTSTVQLSPKGGSNANTKTEPAKSSDKAQATSPSTTTTQNRRTAAARAQQQAQQQAKESIEQAANATSMEAQIAVQANVVAAMGFVPGFSAYQNTTVVDILGRELNKQYGKPVIDNARAQRQLSGASDRIHQQMVDEQYR